MSRTPRELEDRESEKRTSDDWRPPALLPTPFAKPGVKFRWIRTSALGEGDIKNVSSRFREGWEPVKAADHPELEVLKDEKSKHPDGVEIGGLLLCQTDETRVEQRSNYYANRAQEQMNSVDNQYLRENDPRMPLLKPERKTRTTFGSGS